MGKINQKGMDLNKETAMRLWNRFFGNETQAKDYAGRKMAKGAYNDRNSEFGWNVDHILPQSKGGKTNDFNLICCHIKTNDEKADRFPCFNANGSSFEIVKVQNHYEIRSKSKNEQKESKETEPDLFDSADGLRLYKSLKGIQNKKRFVGTVFIVLDSVSDGAVLDFLEKVFEKESISYAKSKDYPMILLDGCCAVITVKKYDMKKSDASELLDKCVLANTYLSGYFSERKLVRRYAIYYRGDLFESKMDMMNKNIAVPNVSKWNSLLLNETILSRTDAGNKVSTKYALGRPEYEEYSFVFTQLHDNLKKEANG